MKPHLNLMAYLYSYISKYCYQVIYLVIWIWGLRLHFFSETSNSSPDFTDCCSIQISTRQPANRGSVTANLGLCEFSSGDNKGLAIGLERNLPTYEKNWVLLKAYLGKGLISRYHLNGSFFFRDIENTFFFFKYLFIYLWLCWVLVSVRGLSPVVASGGHSPSRCAGLSPSRPLPLRSTGSRCAGSAIVAHGPSHSAACGILPDQGSNPCPLHWQADSQPPRHQGSLENTYLNKLLILYICPLLMLIGSSSTYSFIECQAMCSVIQTQSLIRHGPCLLELIIL